MRALERFAGPLHALLRIAAGFLFFCHGAQKLFGLFGGKVATQTLYQVAGVIETATGALLVLGLLTSWAAFLASGTMAVAYFYAHAPRAFWPIENRGELAALYAFLVLYLAARGPGPFALDRLRGRRR